MMNKFLLSEEDNLYLPPEMRDGILVSGLLVSEGTSVESEDNQTITQKVGLLHESEVQPVVRENNGEVTVVDEAVEQTGSNEKILVDGEDPSVLAEEERESSRDSANGEGSQDVSVEGIASEIPRIQLAQATEEDTSIEHMRKLATLEKEGYHYLDGILFKTRLDA